MTTKVKAIRDRKIGISAKYAQSAIRTHTEIAIALGTSRQRVAEIEKRALAKLFAVLAKGEE